VQKYQQIVQKLSEQTISADFSQAIQENLKTQLQTRLSDLVQNLQIENQAKAILANSLPRLAQSEIEQQLKPMTDQIIKRMTSVEQYQQKLAELIQQVSSRL
jgi:ribosomal protein S13